MLWRLQTVRFSGGLGAKLECTYLSTGLYARSLGSIHKNLSGDGGRENRGSLNKKKKKKKR